MHGAEQHLQITDIATVSGSRQTMQSVNRQLKEYLPEGGTLASYSFESGIPKKIYAKVLLLTGESFLGRLKEMDAVWEDSRIVIAERSVNVEYIRKLVSIGTDQTVLLVNDSLASAQDAIESLQSIGFSQWKYIPYSPEVDLESLPKDKISCTISVGEPDLVPSGFGRVYEIGTRIISIKSIVEIWSWLGWPFDIVDTYIHKYMEQVITMSQHAYDSTNRLDAANRNLLALINAMDDGMMVYDRNEEKIEFWNNHLRILSGIVEDVAGLKLRDVIPDGELVEFLVSGPEVADSILTEWNGKSLMATRFPLEGIREVCMFRSVETIQTDSSKLNRKLIEKGLYSKYSFDDIYGRSEEIQNTKKRALRLAQTDLNILIEGESGTGKEMFAVAIHQASDRRDKPYLAINFSALNDSLMESELFGYEEGAFTGARRGGKAGVFEMADGGTIFLDEIGDISPKMQVGLLRVLQEKEVMRIGDGKIRYVDVRIIAATNQNLMEKVKQGLFREDLYYRLKIGHLYIPPLRSHREDIPYLAQMLLLQDSQEDVSMSPELLEWMENRPWPGNVRELKNTITYMNAMRTGLVITLDDIPEQQYPGGLKEKYEHQDGDEKEILNRKEKTSGGDPLLDLIGTLLEEDVLLGRRKLLEEAKRMGICQTEYQLRKRLAALEQNGSIIMGKGKVGIRLR